jgi:hypothetical protein
MCFQEPRKAHVVQKWIAKRTLKKQKMHCFRTAKSTATLQKALQECNLNSTEITLQNRLQKALQRTQLMH